MRSSANGQYGVQVWEEKIRRQGEIGVVGGTASSLSALNRDRQRLMSLFDKEIKSTLKPGAKIIDLGVGPLARFAIEFAKRGYEVTGIDFSETTLDRARDNIQREGVKVRLLKADITEIDKINKKFDLAFCQSTFYHIPPHLAGLSLVKITKILNPKGRLLIEFGIFPKRRFKDKISVPFYWIGHYFKSLFGQGFKVNVSRFNSQEIKEMVEKSGFKIEKRLSESILLLKKI